MERNDAIEKQIYTSKDLREILQLSRNSVYALLKHAPFPVMKMGNRYKVPVEGFDAWLNQR